MRGAYLVPCPQSPSTEYVYAKIFHGVMFMHKTRLKSLRVDRDVKQSTLAELLDVTQATYSRYENDRITLPRDVIFKLAEYYQVSTDYLLGVPNAKGPEGQK